MQTIDQYLLPSGYAGANVTAEGAASNDVPWLVLGMPCQLVVHVVDANGDPATPAGLAKAVEILDRHETLTAFLDSLGVDPDTAEADACRMEHILSEPTLDAIRRYLARHKIKIIPARKVETRGKAPVAPAR